jgi:cyclic pyranopterin phosphate synthase
VEINEKNYSIIVYCLVSADSKTGVEMEALSGVNSALLAIYDLSKIVEPNLKITNTKLLVKAGGKKGLWINPDGIPDKIKSTLNL